MGRTIFWQPADQIMRSTGQLPARIDHLRRLLREAPNHKKASAMRVELSRLEAADK